MTCTLSAGLRAGILPEVYIVSIYPCVIPVEAYTRRLGAGRTTYRTGGGRECYVKRTNDDEGGEGGGVGASFN